MTEIETTYEVFGIRGIVEHYALAALPRSKTQAEELHIPFFEKDFAIIYNGKEKHHGECAELLKATIEEKLSTLGVAKPQIRTVDENAPKKDLGIFEETRHLLYIGVPDSAKSLAKIIKWEFDQFGMRFGTSGEKSIITVEKLKKKDFQGFAEFVKQNESRWEGDASKTVRLLKQNFIKDSFDKDDPAIVNILATTVGWPLLLAGGILDIFSNAELKENLMKFQYYVAIDSFISSKIDPYFAGRK